MLRRLNPKKFMFSLMLVGLLLTPVGIYAQDTATQPASETAATEQQPPSGLASLVLLVGVGVVILAGGYLIAMETYRPGGDS